MGSIQLLDCTLRDGGHLTGGKFGENIIRYVLQKLVDAKIDIIEAGFLMNEQYTSDYARFKSIADARKVLPADKGSSKISLMADFVDLSEIEPCNGTVDIIRLSFKHFRLDWALKTARILIDKGYKVFINPVNCNIYSDEQYIEVLKRVNDIHPYAFSIVDTFGALRMRSLSRFYYLVDSNLDSDIHIGLHLHENLGLAYSLAQHFITINEGKRDIVIDASLLGMGRAPGNLCIEQIMGHLNYYYGGQYNTAAAYDAIDDCIVNLKRNTQWGYAIPYALSAKYQLHRTYAEFLMNKWRLHTRDIEQILSEIPKEESILFNEEFVERLYRDFVSVKYDDADNLKNFADELRGKNAVIVAPGSSLSEAENRERVKNYVKDNNAVVIAVHFMPDFVSCDYLFYTNIKRFEISRAGEFFRKLIITSNILRYNPDEKCRYVFEWARLANHDGIYSDDSTLMLVNLLRYCGVNEIAAAGFDGFTAQSSPFYSGDSVHANGFSRGNDFDKTRELTARVIREKYSGAIKFLTRSIYE